MTIRLLPLAAAAALAAGTPAAAADPHGGHGHAHGDVHAQKSPHGDIVQGTLVNGVRTVEMQVTSDGFVPSKIKANKGEKLRLVVTRKTDRTCATEIVVKDHGIEKKLPLDQPVTVEFTPSKSGEIKYACGMGHITGVVFVP
jgi:plastocyanin domain-containing protein